MEQNTVLINAFENGTGTVNLSGFDNRLATAIDVVDYPVVITNAYYKMDGEFHRADGDSPTGRDKHFNLVLTDPCRTGDFGVVAAVTGKYGTMSTPDLYRQLDEQLKSTGLEYEFDHVYVTGNGGAQSLHVELPAMMGMNGIPDEVVMRIRLLTSVDGSNAHTLSMYAYNKNGEYQMGDYGGEHKLKARHTTTIDVRTMDFMPTINKLVGNWNDLIIPTMVMLYDKKFNHQMATDMLSAITEKAGIGEGHRENIVTLYESKEVRTKDVTDSLYRINACIGQYIDDNLSRKPELQERFRLGVAKAIKKYL